MENHVADVVHELLNVKAEAKNAMEIFLSENDIPISIIKENSEHIAYMHGVKEIFKLFRLARWMNNEKIYPISVGVLFLYSFTTGIAKAHNTA